MRHGIRRIAYAWFLLTMLGAYPAWGEATAGSIVGWGSHVVGVDLSSGFTAVAAGGLHSLGLKTDGSIVAWGHNWYGQCDMPSPNTDFVAVAAGYSHSLGLKADGSIVAWGAGQPGQSGEPHYGQCDVPSPNTDFVAVAGGGSHSLGLKADGSIVAWGYNWYDQCDVPLPNTDFVAVAGGGYHSLGLKADGSIVAWGDNWAGQCDVPSPNTDFVAVAGGDFYSLGIKRQTMVPPTLAAAVSRRQHGGAGEFDIPLALQSPATIEPRTGGAMRQLVLTFDQEVEAMDGTADCSEVTVTNGACQAVSIAGGEMTIDMTFNNNTCVSVEVNGIGGAGGGLPLAGDNDVRLVVHQGNVSADEDVNVIDLQDVKNHAFEPVDATNFIYDINCDGEINVIDLQATKNNVFVPVACD